MQHQESNSLVRLEIIGLLARAASLALQDSDKADQVEFNVIASAEQMDVDVALLSAGTPITGWGS